MLKTFTAGDILTHLCTPNPGGVMDPADVSLGYSLSDTIQQVFTGTKALVPVQTIRAGALFSPDWCPYPWGWLPEEA